MSLYSKGDYENIDAVNGIWFTKLRTHYQHDIYYIVSTLIRIMGNISDKE